MNSEQHMRDPLRDYANNPEKIKRIITSFPNSERTLVDRTLRLLLDMKFSREEFNAYRTVRTAKAIENLKEQFLNITKKKDDPVITLQLDTSAIHGEINSEIDYWAGYSYVTWTLPGYFVLLQKNSEAGTWWIFPHGLPVGLYWIGVDWYLDTGQEKCKLQCNASSNVESAVDPGKSIVKYTEPATNGLFSGIDMIWHVVEPNKYIRFTIKNYSGESIACLGVTFAGVF